MIVLTSLGWGGWQVKKLKKVVYITVYETIELEEDEEEVEGTVLGGGSDEVSIIPVFYPPWIGYCLITQLFFMFWFFF